jgi:hypothetical protein
MMKRLIINVCCALVCAAPLQGAAAARVKEFVRNNPRSVFAAAGAAVVAYNYGSAIRGALALGQQAEAVQEAVKKTEAMHKEMYWTCRQGQPDSLRAMLVRTMDVVGGRVNPETGKIINAGLLGEHQDLKARVRMLEEQKSLSEQELSRRVSASLQADAKFVAAVGLDVAARLLLDRDFPVQQGERIRNHADFIPAVRAALLDERDSGLNDLLRRHRREVEKHVAEKLVAHNKQIEAALEANRRGTKETVGRKVENVLAVGALMNEKEGRRSQAQLTSQLAACQEQLAVLQEQVARLQPLSPASPAAAAAAPAS